MAYIGVSPSNGVRRKHTYTATANQTSFSGAGAEGATLSYTDSNFVDVYQNGVKLSEADYTSTSGTAIVLAQGASVSDMVEIVVYDVFSVADTVSKADGGTFDGAITANAGVVVDEMTLDGDTLTATDTFTIDAVGDITLDAASTLVRIKHSGTQRFIFNTDATPEIDALGGDFTLHANTSDADIIFKGNDGGSAITALTLDMSDAGVATFNSSIVVGASVTVGGSIYVGGTAAANAFDDYEEGTWTPSFSGNIAFSQKINFTYTKIGRLVHITGYLSGKSGSFGTSWAITNLPFVGNANYNMAALWSHGADFDHMAYINNNSASLNVRDRDNANQDNLSEISVQMTYITS